jgi:hypothetical protein
MYSAPIDKVEFDTVMYRTSSGGSNTVKTFVVAMMAGTVQQV